MTDKLKLDGRKVFLPQGRDPIKDLVDAIATSPAHLFAQDGQTLWLKDTGELAGVGRDELLELTAKYIVTKELVQHGDHFRVEYKPYVPDEMTLRALLNGEGDLAGRLPKAPSEPTKMTSQKQREIRDRLNIGERPDSLARAYGVDADTIRAIGR